MIDTQKLREAAGNLKPPHLDIAMLLLGAAQAYDAQTAEIARLQHALGWYRDNAKSMSSAAIRGDSKDMLVLMHNVAVDGGKRARAALPGESK